MRRGEIRKCIYTVIVFLIGLLVLSYVLYNLYWKSVKQDIQRIEKLEYHPIPFAVDKKQMKGDYNNKQEYKRLINHSNASENDIKALITKIADENNFNADYLVKLANCESSMNPKAKNVNKDNTVDRGLFQINNYWHPDITDKQAYDPYWSTKWTVEQLKQGKHNMWVCHDIIKK